ncbi:F-box protein CPR1-like [Papaver somniferum]|uniref:F-box protein CPR1-like n=1 Tax=Papaver somniferum TaxID=3469 RepID=UPI000E70053A|nr:F-box protein CPR1-like [Papaver somniferum]
MGYIPLPQNIIPPTDFSGDVDKNVGVLGDSICVGFIWDSVRLDVWVTQQYGVMESWIKKFTMTQLPCLLLWPWKPLLCFDDGKILVDYYCNQLLLFDPTNETVRSVVVRDIAMDDNRESYVETIASLGSSTFLERKITDETMKNPKLRRRLSGL